MRVRKTVEPMRDIVRSFGSILDLTATRASPVKRARSPGWDLSLDGELYRTAFFAKAVKLSILQHWRQDTANY